MGRRLAGADVSTAALLLVTVALTPGYAQAGTHSPAEIAAARQQILRTMLTNEYAPGLIANARRNCAAGAEPADVVESRAQGAYFTPDASDECLTALIRTARDGRLHEFYRDLLIKVGGDAGAFERWPRVIGDAVLAGKTSAAIGNRKAIEVTPALAFDAGFTVAYRDGTTDNAPPDAAQLKTLAESCLAQHQDAGTCYSVGYTYGTQALSGWTAAAR